MGNRKNQEEITQFLESIINASTVAEPMGHNENDTIRKFIAMNILRIRMTLNT